MRLKLFVIVVLSICLQSVSADEGMWLLGNLQKNKQAKR